MFWVSVGFFFLPKCSIKQTKNPQNWDKAHVPSQWASQSNVPKRTQVWFSFSPSGFSLLEISVVILTEFLPFFPPSFSFPLEDVTPYQVDKLTDIVLLSLLRCTSSMREQYGIDWTLEITAIVSLLCFGSFFITSSRPPCYHSSSNVTRSKHPFL